MRQLVHEEGRICMYKALIRPILFRTNPETIHHIICILIKLPLVSKVLKLLFHYKSTSLQINVCGLVFNNPVGLAAGFDKDAEMVDQLADLGFGFVEIGTVTPKAQGGNDKPRLFRLPADQALINRMGFNNAGVEKVRRNLLRSKRKCIIGGNIGKNKITPNENAVQDYEICFHRLYEVVDYFVVNVSSPNTPGLRELQDKNSLTQILGHLQKLNLATSAPKPIFLKIAPDLTNDQLNDIIYVVEVTNIAGIIATNTTIERKNLITDAAMVDTIGAGGLSGKPMRERSSEVVRYLSEKSENKFPIIGVGGIYSEDDAREKIAAGASLIQIYTGFIYEGPGIIKNILKKMANKKLS